MPGSLTAGETISHDYLYDKYAATLFAVIARITENEKIAEEVLQYLFVYFLKEEKHFAPAHQPLFTRMLVLAQKMARDKMEASPNLFSPQIQPPHIIVFDNQMGKLQTDAGMQGANAQKVLELVGLKGISIKTASKLLGIPEDEIKMSLRTELIKYRKK